MTLEPGSTLGHYSVTSLLGEGGMGQVYRATDTQLGRDVALKILPDAFAADPDRVGRFQREAQVLASLNHPGIAAIYGIEKSDDTQALVLELVEGPTLADRIAKGPIPLDEALPIAKQIAEALEAAHETGVIHRDLKPGIPAVWYAALTTPNDQMSLRLSTGFPLRRRLLRGSFLMRQREPIAMKQAAVQFEHALTLDPKYAAAYAGLADVSALMGDQGGIDRPAANTAARRAAARAIELSPRLVEPHITLGWREMAYEWDQVSAARHFEQALNLGPDSADAHSRYACYLAWMPRRFDEAVKEAKRGVELEPLDASGHIWLGLVLWCAGRFDEAIAVLLHAMELDRMSWHAHHTLAQTYLAATRYPEAIDEYRAAIGLAGKQPVVRRDGNRAGTVGRRARGDGHTRRARRSSEHGICRAGASRVLIRGARKDRPGIRVARTGVRGSRCLDDVSTTLSLLRFSPG